MLVYWSISSARVPCNQRDPQWWQQLGEGDGNQAVWEQAPQGSITQNHSLAGDRSALLAQLISTSCMTEALLDCCELVSIPKTDTNTHQYPHICRAMGWQHTDVNSPGISWRFKKRRPSETQSTQSQVLFLFFSGRTVFSSRYNPSGEWSVLLHSDCWRCPAFWVEKSFSIGPAYLQQQAPTVRRISPFPPPP